MKTSDEKMGEMTPRSFMNTRTITRIVAPTLLVGGLLMTACNQKVDESASRTLTTDKDKVSYAIGLDIGRSLKQQSLGLDEVDLAKLRIGMEDVLTEATPVLSDSQVGVLMMEFQKTMMAKQDSLRKVKAETNLKESEAFLAKNAKEPGVATTPSGLQYQVITEGTGAKPDSTSKVTVHYTGTLLDSTEFDSSVKRGQPATFPVTGVIPGWTEALKLMSVGSKWKLFVPPSLGYGANGGGSKIGPNAALIFEVELLSIVDPSASDMPAGHSAHDGHGH
jgi:FKBP-type peptidyl-prolyl cis-trans isomerase